MNRSKKEEANKERKVKDTGKIHPRTGRECPEGEYRYSSTLSLTSVLNGGGRSHAVAVLPAGERPGTHCTGRWMGSEAGFYGRGKSRPLRHSIPGLSSL
jgi:hypothetical protein